MLRPYRRHLQACPHKSAAYRSWTCPVWTDGLLEGRRIRKSFNTRNWKQAEDLLLQMSVEGRETEVPVTAKAVRDAYLQDAKDCNLKLETLRKNGRCINALSAMFGCKLKVLVLFLRHSGIRISDAVGLKRDQVEKGKLFLYQAKTGTSVSIPLPKVTLDALKACDEVNAHYFGMALAP